MCSYVSKKPYLGQDLRGGTHEKKPGDIPGFIKRSNLPYFSISTFFTEWTSLLSRR